MDNFVTIVGRLVAEPELRFTPGGDPVVNGRLARNLRTKDTNGEWVDGRAQFFDFSLWGARAEVVARMPKGMLVRIVGELDFREWENTEGERRSKVEIRAKSVDGLLAAADVDENAPHFTATWGVPRGDRPARPTEGRKPQAEAPWRPEYDQGEAFR